MLMGKGSSLHYINMHQHSWQIVCSMHVLNCQFSTSVSIIMGEKWTSDQTSRHLHSHVNSHTRTVIPYCTYYSVPEPSSSNCITQLQNHPHHTVLLKHRPSSFVIRNEFQTRGISLP